jgi:hypothetical protein
MKRVSILSQNERTMKIDRLCIQAQRGSNPLAGYVLRATPRGFFLSLSFLTSCWIAYERFFVPDAPFFWFSSYFNRNPLEVSGFFPFELVYYGLDAVRDVLRTLSPAQKHKRVGRSVSHSWAVTMERYLVELFCCKYFGVARRGCIPCDMF